MSNWLDVRIKLYSDKDQIEEIGKKFKEYFYKTVKRDPNTSVNMGSLDSKFVWCAIKSFDNFNSIVCHTKTGFDEIDAAKVCRWISSKFPDIKGIDIQIRDDGSKIFAIYQWNRSSEGILKCRKIDPMMYPDMTDMLDSYSEAASKTISAALKNSGLISTIGIDKKHDSYQETL